MPHPFPTNREEQAAWARSLLARNDWVTLDTETTGLDKTTEAIQVAILAPDGAELLNSLVCPVGEISPAAPYRDRTLRVIRIDLNKPLQPEARGLTPVTRFSLHPALGVQAVDENNRLVEIGALVIVCERR